MKLAFKAARQRKTIRSGLTRQIGKANVVTHMRMQIIPGAMGDRRALYLRREALSPVAMGGEL